MLLGCCGSQLRCGETAPRGYRQEDKISAEAKDPRFTFSRRITIPVWPLSLTHHQSYFCYRSSATQILANALSGGTNRYVLPKVQRQARGKLGPSFACNFI